LGALPRYPLYLLRKASEDAASITSAKPHAPLPSFKLLGLCHSRKFFSSQNTTCKTNFTEKFIGNLNTILSSVIPENFHKRFLAFQILKIENLSGISIGKISYLTSII
jgi:hypothetical protein